MGRCCSKGVAINGISQLTGSYVAGARMLSFNSAGQMVDLNDLIDPDLQITPDGDRASTTKAKFKRGDSPILAKSKACPA